MPKLKPLSSLRARLIALVLYSLLPAMLVLLYAADASRRQAIADVQQNAVTLVNLVSAGKEDSVEGARRLLFALSLLREVRGGEATACSQRLEEILQTYPDYFAFGMADVDGNVVCHTAAITEPANVAAQEWFQRAIGTGGYALSDYEPGATPGVSSLVLAYAIPGAPGADQGALGVVFTRVPIVSFEQTIADLPLPEGSVMWAIDPAGTVTDRFPDPEAWVGQAHGDSAFVQAIQSEGKGVTEMPGLDGVSRIYAFTPLGSRLITGHSLAVGIPQQIATAESDRLWLRSLGLLALVGLLTIGLAWWASDFLVLRGVQRLIGATRRLRQGDLSVRAELPQGSGEIGQLGSAFDGMAQALEQREVEQKATQAILQAERERLSVTLASIGDGVITTDAAGRVSFMNSVAQALTGWELAEAAGRPLEEVYSLIREAEGEPAEALAVKARRADGAGPARPGWLAAKDGRTVPVEDKVAPIHDKQGLLIGAVLSLRDIRERRQAEAAVRQSRDEISAILQGAAEGITAQDRSGRLRYANDAAARLLGFPSAQALLEAPPDEVTQQVAMFDEGGRPFPAEALPGRVALQGAPAPSAVIRYRVLATGEEYWSAVKATPVFDAQGRVELVVSLFQNITYLKEAELHQRLLADVGKLLAGPLDPTALLAELARVAVPALADWCAVDVRGEAGIIERVAVAHGDPVNAEMAVEPPERVPLDPAAPQGVPKVLRSGVSEFYPAITAEMLQGVTRDPQQLEFLRDLNPKSMMIVPLNARGRTLGAQTFVSTAEGRHYGRAHLELAEEMARRAALALENANLYADAQRLNAELENTVSRRTAQLQASNARLRDEVAERQEAQRRLEESQAQLRRLSAHLQAGREEERTRIAREIHDELGQNLAGLKMGLAWLQKGMPGQDSAARDKLKDMANLVEGTVATVRRIVTELRPRILDELGLAAAIEWQLAEFQQRTGLECVLRSNVAELNLDSERATAVFRLLQEALTNTARHAQATRVLVTIEQGREELRFQVEDNGRGISEADLANSKSFGLLGMRERVNILQGVLSIRGVPGQGTVIEIHFPLSRNSD